MCQDKKAILTIEKIKRNMPHRKLFFNSYSDNCFLIVTKITVFYDQLW